MPINPVDINTHLAQSLNASKVREAQDAKMQGAALQYPDTRKKEEDEEKTSIKKVEETENPNIDADAKKDSEQEKKKRKKEQEESKNKNLQKLADLFGNQDIDRGSNIDIKL